MKLQQRIEKAMLLLKNNGYTIIPPENNIVVYQHEIPSFEQFFDAYGKKVGRRKTENLWADLTDKEKIECMEYIPLYVHSTPNKQYRKNPETFLRNRCWEDEIITNDNGQDNRNHQHKEELNGTISRISALLNN